MLPLSLPKKAVTLFRHAESEGNALIGRQLEAKTILGALRWVRKYRASPECLRETWGITKEGRDRILSFDLNRLPPKPDVIVKSPFPRVDLSVGALIEVTGWYDIPVIQSPELMERYWGFDAGMAWRTIRLLVSRESFRLLQENPLMWKPKGGESIYEVAMGRFLLVLYRIMLAGFERPLLGCHGDIIWACRFLFENMSPEQFREVFHGAGRLVPNCGLVHYEVRPDSTPSAPQLINPWER